MRLAWIVSVRVLRREQIADCDAKGSRQSEKLQGRRIANTALDAAHVAAAKAGDIGQCLLRMALLLSQFSDTHPEPFESRMASGLAGCTGHAADTFRSVSDRTTPDRVLHRSVDTQENSCFRATLIHRQSDPVLGGN